MALTIVLADDHPVVRLGLRSVLEAEPDFQLVGEAADGQEALRLVERLRPDILVLDLMMPGLPGLEVTRQVSQLTPRTRVVILSMYANEAYVAAALRNGALAYVLKGSHASELVRAIRAVAADTRYLSQPLSEQGIELYMQQTQDASIDPYHALTAREREILQLVAEGHTSVAIAARLFISARTVESHRSNFMTKLGLRTQTELVRYALRRGILPLEE